MARTAQLSTMAPRFMVQSRKKTRTDRASALENCTCDSNKDATLRAIPKIPPLKYKSIRICENASDPKIL